MNDSDLLSTADVAGVLNLSADMVRVLAREGRPQSAAKTVRGVRLFCRSDVETLRAERAGLAGHGLGVQSYEDENHLINVVADFASDGLRAGGPAVTVATPSHREALHKRLALDAGASSRVAWLDAAETLGAIMVDGLPALARFQAVVSTVIKRVTAAAQHRRKRAETSLHEAVAERDRALGELALSRHRKDERSLTFRCSRAFK
jgi:hypothetical protein